MVHIARLQALGDECRVTAYKLLKELGKTDTGKNRDTLDRRLSRIKATGLDVKVGRYGYEGSLIDEVYRDGNSRAYVIRLNPKLRAIFEPDQFTQIEWAVRHKLDGKPLAQWLHGYYSSHAKPYPVKVETLHKLCGSEAELRRFRQTLCNALADVAEASKFHGLSFRSELRGNLVFVERKPTKSQRRHLGKKASKTRQSRT